MAESAPIESVPVEAVPAIAESTPANTIPATANAEPEPVPANAAEVLQDVVISCMAEYPDYPYNQQQDMTAIVTVTAPVEVDDEDDDKRPPIDLVCVMDKSGSMSGTKFQLVKKTMKFIIAQLNNKDRLSLVIYDTQVSLVFGLMKMTKENKESCQIKVDNLQTGSSTNLSGGLLTGLCQILDRPATEKNDVASVLLLTDGLANHGIQNVDGICDAMKNPKKYAGPQQPQNQPQQQQRARTPGFMQRMMRSNPTPPPAPAAAPVQAAENIPEAPPVPESTAPPSGEVCATVYCFGFGADHDPDFLKKISDAGNGMYYFIERDDQIAETFGHCLGGLLSTVAQGIQMTIEFQEGVTIKESHITRPTQNITPNSIKVDVGDLQSEESRDFVIELSLEAVQAPLVQAPGQILLQVQVDYFNVLKKQLAECTGNLGVLRTEQVDRKQEDINWNVRKQVKRVRMVSAIKKSKEDAEAGRMEAAAERCQAIENEMADDEAMAGGIDLYGGMKDDLAQARDNYSNQDHYRMKGKYMEMNMMQEQSCQRSAMPSGSTTFATKSKAKKASKGKSWLSK